MKLGVDISVADELQHLNPKYIYKGKEVEPFDFFGHHSKIAVTRIRLWHNPYDDNGNRFGGGTNDLPAFIRMAKKAQENGMGVMLDFHYSDFYVDPSRQRVPRAWEGLSSYAEVVKAMYEYTLNTLKTIKENGIDLVAIQVGNEISHGMLWPYGDQEKQFNEKDGGGFRGLCGLLKAGIKACNEVFPNAKTVIHLEHSGSFDMQQWYFDNILAEGVEFDVIGESYYPYWHGPFAMFEDCVTRLKKKYGKEIWVVELGYQYEPTKNPNYSEVTDAKEGDFIIGNVNGRIPFEQSKQGQADYVGMMLQICKRIGVGMVFYWEPTWIYVPGNGWADDAGQIYCGLTPMPADNAWVTETFFDRQGEANPVVDVFTQDYVDSIK
ncbi:MAG: arabinogalactan endo-1,4-beta-galactosidase [Bacilli bacterium]|nr:arabinogalactan endo-1,4-beta-galactosidase [Bacilli bacterium]